MSSQKVMTLRLSTEMAEALEDVASVSGESVSDVIREAIAEEILTRRNDATFQKNLREYIARAERLTKP